MTSDKMILSSLQLTNFRSYARASFSFSPATTLILGPNAAGKTNMLEAVYLLATGKSFRAQHDREMIRWGQELGRVSAEVASTFSASPPSLSPSAPPAKSANGVALLEKGRLPAPDQKKLEVVITSGSVGGQKAPTKKYLINGVPRRMIDFVGNLRAVLFWPEHLELVTDSPSLRRSYLDSILVQVDREYRRNLVSYERALRQRNRLLDLINEGKAHRHQLLFWDQLLIRTGSYLTDKRNQYLDFVNKYETTGMKYQVVYDKSVISESRLIQYAQEEIAAKATLVGPHRDDFDVVMGKNLSLAAYGSRGEQRLAVLWLKLAELKYNERETGDRPLLLLDDIFSELDTDHQAIVLQLVNEHQTLITSADPEIATLLKKKKLVELKILNLRG
ncbi:MAG: DNA replication/repair protein RecF [Patescibacteria group bacterium]